MSHTGVCCSFCGKDEEHYRVRIVPGPGVYICEECVAVAVYYLVKEGEPLKLDGGIVQISLNEGNLL